MRKERTATLLVTSTLAVIISSTSVAEPYYWIYDNRYGPNFPTLSSGCDATVAWLEKISPTSTFEQRYFKFANEELGGCFWKQFYQPGKWVEVSQIFKRYGNSCPLGQKRIQGKPETPCECEEGTINPAAGTCSSGAQKGTPPATPGPCEISGFSGNPVNLLSGNKFQMETDYVAPAGSPLRFERFYNSLDGQWRTTYSMHVDINGISAVLTNDDGREIYFTAIGELIAPEETQKGKLSKTATGWSFRAENNELYQFDLSGALVSVTSQLGNQQLSRSGNETSVTDDLGNTLKFSRDVIGQPLTLEVSGSQTNYTYNSTGQLITSNKAYEGQNTERLYHYEEHGEKYVLTKITDENGVDLAKWTYDAKGRAISSEHTGETEKVDITYNDDGSVEVLNAYGKKSVYHYETISGVQRIVSIEGEASPNCPYSNSSFTYDARALLTNWVDAKGNLTTYAYNDRGLEISRTEASGTTQARTVTTEWHPSLYLKTKVTEPSRITTYQYDAQGRQIGQIVTPR